MKSSYRKGYNLAKKVGRRMPVGKKVVAKLEDVERRLAQAGFSATGSIPSHKDRAYVDYEWFQHNYPTTSQVARERELSKKFKRQPVVSIIMPTFNTEPDHLIEAIESVIAQSYENWELCIADDKSTNLEVREIINQYVKKDDRIRKVLRRANGHISKASNSALKIATGEYIGLLDHDDVLWPNALFESVKAINKNPRAKLFYSDEDKLSEHGTHFSPFFKPDWSPYFMRTLNVVTHFAVLHTKTVRDIGGWREGLEGAQDWDLFLRVSRESGSVPVHIPKVLYSWRLSDTSTAKNSGTKPYIFAAQKKAISEHLDALKVEHSIEKSNYIPDFWNVSYPAPDAKVSIIIPTLEQYDYLKRCISSVIAKTIHLNYEIVIVDTGSTSSEIKDYYNDLTSTHSHIKVVENIEPKFSFSNTCNVGAKGATGEYLLFLNNDTEVLSPEWIKTMLGDASQPDVGMVGARLLFENNTLQHAGVVMGLGGYVAPVLQGIPDEHMDHWTAIYGATKREMSVVTAACVMVKADRFEEVGGFDPDFRITYNDVDICLKLLEKGYRNIYNPHVRLHHYESVSVGLPDETNKRDTEEFEAAKKLLLDRWGNYIKNDPYYNPNLSKGSGFYETASIYE